MSAIKLLPCPFCGGEAEFSKGKTGDGEDWHYVECGACAAMGPHVEYASHNIAVKEAIAEAWNRRTDLLPRPAADYVAGLEAALKAMLQSVCGPVGFAEAVRHNSGRAYPWPSLDAAELQSRFILAACPASPDTRVVTPQEAAEVLLALGEMPLDAKLAAVHEYANRDKGGCRPVALTEAWKAALRAIIAGGQDRG